MVDFHCHLDLYPDYKDLIDRVEQSRIMTLAVTTTPMAWPHNKEITTGLKFVHSALGLHPQLVGERSEEIVLWDEYFNDSRYIGEVGLDASPQHYKTLTAQQKIFNHILQRCARAGDRVISIHSVRAARLVMNSIEDFLPINRGKVVLHWFSGSSSELKKAISLGCFFSVNERMLCDPSKHSLVRSIPLNYLLTETDGPFISLNNRRVEPNDITRVVKLLARLHQTSEDLINEITYRNAKALINS